MRMIPAIALLLAVALGGCSSDDDSTPPPATACDEAAPTALRACIWDVNAALADCYAGTGTACGAGEPSIASALADLDGEVTAACADGEFLSLSAAALAGRLRNSCLSEASSLAWRTFGGPQGAVWSDSDNAERSCLVAAHAAAATLVDDVLGAIDNCLAGDACDVAALAGERASLAAAATADVDAACGALDQLIALDAASYVQRAGHQADCITATGHADTGSLPLGCGPTNADFAAPRGEWTQIVVNGDKWGTLCGDGSPYAFQVNLAPEGERLDRIIIGLQGGGVCLFESDCAARFASNPGLFNAFDDDPFGTGIASDDPAVSPFANWTRVFLPYCTQDVFAGGGVFEDLGSITVPRYGAVNLRAAVSMVRDVVWKMMDEQGGAGFRPDEIVALFGGWSAGGYGTLYNYHWLLDDLQWPRTAGFPDAGLALDNGSLLGVRGLGAVKIPAWGVLPHLPPYCFVGDCAVGEVIFEAIAPRLKQVPEQQLLLLTNPLDRTQQNDAFFEDEPSFINTLRRTYCDTRHLNGIRYYITSVSDESVHVVTPRPNLWEGEVDGETMRDWFVRAVTQPDTLENRVEEADFVDAIPGVEPYPCEVAP